MAADLGAWDHSAADLRANGIGMKAEQKRCRAERQERRAIAVLDHGARHERSRQFWMRKAIPGIAFSTNDCASKR